MILDTVYLILGTKCDTGYLVPNIIQNSSDQISNGVLGTEYMILDTWYHISMVTNENRLSPYLGCLF